MSSVAAPPLTRNWPLRLTYAAVAVNVLLLVASPFGLRFWIEHRAERQLAEAIAETDQLDPRWRLEDLDAQRPAIRPEENAATHVLAAGQILTGMRNWPADGGAEKGYHSFESELYDVPANQQLGAELNEYVRTELARASAARSAAAQLPGLPRGKYPPDRIISPHGVLVRWTEQPRNVAKLFRLDVCLQLQSGDRAAALAAWQGLSHAGTSIGNEPDAAAQLVRMAIRQTAVRTLARILAQTEPTPAELLRIQDALTADAAEPLFLTCVRADRASLHHTLSGPHAREFLNEDSSWLRPKQPASDNEDDSEESETIAKFREQWRGFVASEKAFVSANHGAMLRWLLGIEQIARLPVERRFAALERANQEAQEGKAWKGKSRLEQRLDLPAIWSYPYKLGIAHLRSVNELHLARAALAAERFRLTTGRWPRQLSEFVPGQLEAVPSDLFGSGPLRLRHVADGLIIYSVGDDGKDDGGDLELDAFRNRGRDAGFRLWNPEQRRQLPLPLREDPPQPPPTGEEER